MGYLNSYIVPTAFTVFFHAIVIFFVLVGWQMSDSHRFQVETPRYVKAELVTLEPAAGVSPVSSCSRFYLDH